MFGMGLTEIFLIAIVAVLFLGPDKLPSTMIEIAKFFPNFLGNLVLFFRRQTTDLFKNLCCAHAGNLFF